MGASNFNEMEIDAVGEIMNISLGASATAVSTLLGARTNITTPVVSVESRSQFSFQNLEPAIAVEISYVEGLSGTNVMMFSKEDVRIIVGMMMGQEIPPEEFVFDEMNKSAICEVMNQMMGSSATALSEFLGYTVNISTPVSFEVPNAAAFKDKYFPGEEDKVVVRFNLAIDQALNSEFLIIMDAKLVKELLRPYAASLGQDTSEEDTLEEPPVLGQEETVVAPESSSKEPPAFGEEDQTEKEETAEAPVEEKETSPEISDEEAKAVYQGMNEKHALDQNETDAILARLKEEAAASSEETKKEEAEEAPASNNPVQTTGQPAPTPTVNTGSQTAPVQYVSAPDPALTQILSALQQSQNQMMNLMQEMHEEKKEREKKLEARKEARKQETGGIVRSLSAPEYSELQEDGEEIEANREMLMKVPVEISVEIGRTRKPIKEVLDLTQGSLVVLDKMAGEQADLYVNGECIAHGDIVVVEDNFGIRITEILNKDIYREVQE
ncbi:flagellar motor switch phosphatase FliY [Lachnospiraceae bacterium YH-ros2228]